MQNIEKIKNSLRNTPWGKNLSDEELTQKAKERLEKQDILKNLTFCMDEEEEKYASKLIEDYLAESSISSVADKDTLKQLIDNSILIERIKKELKKEYGKGNPTIPLKMLEELRALEDLNYSLKERLGLTKKDSKTALEEWTKLKEKALNYYKEHEGCNVVKCPYCQKLFMLLKDVRNYTAEKIPMFKRTLLYNKKLFEMYEQNRVTKEELSIILGVSNDYIDYIFDKIYLNEKNDK
jgi:superfamily II DNA helicase RecQ